MGSCKDCGAKTHMLQPVCTSCTRRQESAKYSSFVEAFKSSRPELFEAWENFVKDSGNWDKFQNWLTLIKDGQLARELEKNLSLLYIPRYPSTLLLDQVPTGDKVLAYAQGIDKREKLQDCIWLLTDKNVLIARFSSMSFSEQLGSELVPLEQITGFEKNLTDRKKNLWDMTISRASNIDGITTVDEAVATRMLSSYTKNRSNSGSKETSRPQGKDPVESIRSLKALLDDGLISQAEFDEKRKKLVDEM